MKKKSSTKQTPQRWFLDCDEDGHNFLIPADKRAIWESWIDLPWSDTKYKSVPDFVRPVNDCYSNVTFTDPIDET